MRTMTIDNLLSGLVGAVLALIGAVVIAWNDRRQDDRAAARAVFMEVAANSAALVLAVKHGVYATVSSTTWAGSHLRLARALSPAELVTVATFYMHIDAMLAAGFVAGKSDPRLTIVAGEILGRSVEAASVLEGRGWGSGERAEVREALKELAPKS